MTCKHIWKQIETNSLAKPIKYKCINCLLIYKIKKKVNPNDSFDKRNSIFSRIKTNTKKIGLITLNHIGFNERLHIEDLAKENAKFRELLHI